jgi:hypothetical protein
MNSADWKAPTTDGGVLVSPGLDQLVASARENHRRLSDCSVIIADKPLHVWRQQMRQILGHANSDQLLICSGHQAELYHPGVWIKLALVNRIAHVTNGRALQIAVDSDAPKHLQLRWPKGGTELSPRMDSTIAWAGRLPPPSAEHLQAVMVEVKQAVQEWDFQSLLPDFLTSLIQTSRSQPSLCAAVVQAMQQLDHQLGLSYELCMTEPIWSSDPYLAFVSHLLANAKKFAHSYNQALAKYRAEERIKSPGRPMPDLALNSEQIELPFWLDNLTTGRRQRLALVQTPLGPRLGVGSAALDVSKSSATDLSQFCEANQFRIAPRALALTMFLRLFACDQWIHGIGGARYDQVTDQIIRDFFRFDPPTFGVTTATLYFPSATSRQRTSLPAIQHLGHQLKHRVLGTKKTTYLEQINHAPRRSSRRAEIFAGMHRDMDKANSLPMAERDEKWQRAQLNAAEDRTLFDRELFYGLQPIERLEQLRRQLG